MKTLVTSLLMTALIACGDDDDVNETAEVSIVATAQSNPDLSTLVAVVEFASDNNDLVTLLAREIEQHVKEERDHLFPKARAAQGLDLDALGAQLKERQQELQGQAA